MYRMTIPCYSWTLKFLLLPCSMSFPSQKTGLTSSADSGAPNGPANQNSCRTLWQSLSEFLPRAKRAFKRPRNHHSLRHPQPRTSPPPREESQEEFDFALPILKQRDLPRGTRHDLFRTSPPIPGHEFRHYLASVIIGKQYRAASLAESTVDELFRNHAEVIRRELDECYEEARQQARDLASEFGFYCQSNIRPARVSTIVRLDGRWEIWLGSLDAMVKWGRATEDPLECLQTFVA